MEVLLRADKPSTQILLEKEAAQLQLLLGRNTQQEVRVDANQPQQQSQPQYEDQQNSNQQSQQQQRQQQHQEGENFLQQLRLGLISEDA